MFYIPLVPLAVFYLGFSAAMDTIKQIWRNRRE